MQTPLESQYDARMSGKLLLIYICNVNVLSHFLLIYICKLQFEGDEAFEIRTFSVKAGTGRIFRYAIPTFRLI